MPDTPGRSVRDRIKLEIMYDLGYPVVRVEVIEPWIDSAIDRAVREFSRHYPGSEEWVTFQAEAGTQRYRVPDDYVAVRNVVYRPEFGGLFYFDLFPGWGMWYDWVRNYVNLTDYVIADMYIEMSQRVLGVNGTWEFFHPYIYLYPTPKASMPVFALVQKIIKEDAIREESWVRRYALATVKARLGRVRSKYAALPGPRGNLELDGKDLLAEAKDEIAKLEDELRKEYEEPLGFFTG